MTFAQGASAAGEFVYLTFDAAGHAVRRNVVKTLNVRDDHNAGSALIYPDRPALAAYSGHDTGSAVLARKAPGANGVAGDGSVDALGEEVVAGGAIPGGQSTTYATLVRKPGTSVTLLFTRVGARNWRYVRSTNSGTTWGSGRRISSWTSPVPPRATSRSTTMSKS
ncbi:hypothetical protein [Microbacterium album]|uniref:hypothetical protein n=1 Tax=Microbacterium album TaxID=2053191 RepID=UPI0016641140|nr:hypothetical protein [Microbacterium album]